MDHLEAPPTDIWNERREWFDGQVFEHQGLGNHLLSEQACALMMEVQSCYCAGAWIAVVVLAFTVIDAQLSQAMAPDFEGNSAGLLRHLEFGGDYQQLRLRRTESSTGEGINLPSLSTSNGAQDKNLKLRRKPLSS